MNDNKMKQFLGEKYTKTHKECFLKNIEGDIWTNDPDDSMEARNFYSSYWQDVLSCDVGLFRGDTILSFNTIAGCTIRLLPIYSNGTFEMPKSSKERLLIITGSEEVSDTIKESFQSFYAINHTFANFMPLIKTEKYYKWPKVSPYLQYVKNKDYHEFPDLFFAAIRLYYYDKDKSNPRFSEDSNPKYFKIFGTGPDGWHDFIVKNHLQDFFIDDEYKELIQLAPQYVDTPYTETIAKNLSDEEKKNCMQQIEIFVANAVTIIKNRASRLAGSKQK